MISNSTELVVYVMVSWIIYLSLLSYILSKPKQGRLVLAVLILATLLVLDFSGCHESSNSVFSHGP